MQINLDLFNAEHLSDCFVVENDLILALTLEVADFGVVDALDVLGVPSIGSQPALAVLGPGLRSGG